MRHLSDKNNWRRTKRGKLSNIYDNIMKRVRGYSNRPWLYAGLEVEFSRLEFIEYYMNDEEYNDAYRTWVDTGYEIRYAPSPDRLDNTLGYSFDNIEFVPFYINCRRGALSKAAKA